MTLRKLAPSLVLLMALGMTGCGGKKHVAIPTGATGITLGNGKAAFPNKNGELEVGDYDMPAGDLIRRPVNQKEVIDALQASGVKLVPQEVSK